MTKKNKKLIKELNSDIKEIDNRITTMFKKEKLQDYEDDLKFEENIELFLKECLELKTKRDELKKKRYFESLRDFPDIMKKHYENKYKKRKEIEEKIEEKAKKILEKNGIIIKKIIFEKTTDKEMK